MKGVGAKSRKPSISKSERSLSRKSVSRRLSKTGNKSLAQKSVGFSSVNKSIFSRSSRKHNPTSIFKKKTKKKLPLLTIPEAVNPLLLRTEILNSNLKPEEDALFMLFEVFHDIITDDRGDPSDNEIVKGICEEPLQVLCRNVHMRGQVGLINLDKNAEKNAGLMEIYLLILSRLVEGKYSNFEKIFFVSLIEYITTLASKQRLEIRQITEVQMGRIGYIFHDAGDEEKYQAFGARTLTKFGNIDQWEKHPKGLDEDEDFKNILETLHSNFTQSGFLNLQKYVSGNSIRMRFIYYSNVNGDNLIPVNIRIDFATNENDEVYQSYIFNFQVGDEGTFEPFPSAEPRRHCFSVAEAKHYLAEHFRSNEADEETRHGLFMRMDDGSLIFHPHVLKIFAMKAIGDKVSFFDAKFHGTINLGAQAAAVSHDRLALAYLIRDMERKLSKSRDFRLKSNLVIPIKSYDLVEGARGGFSFENPRYFILCNKGAQVFSELRHNHLERQRNFNTLSIQRETMRQFLELKDQGLTDQQAYETLQRLQNNRVNSANGVGGKTKKKKPKKKRLKKKQRTLRKKI